MTKPPPPDRPDPRTAALGLLGEGAVEDLERQGLALVWKDELDDLAQHASEARRLHQELQELRREINRQYQGKPLK